MADSGRLIGPYRLLSVLGRGAMGEVWRARDERLDRLVALKLLPRGAKRGDEQRARMLREAKAAASIPHPNVVTLFDIVSDEGEDVLVMELVDGQTLSDRVKEGTLEPTEAVNILHDICDALVFAHDKGILHRDIKTANVMQASDGTIKVLDFGLAKLRAQIEVDDTIPPPVRPEPRESTSQSDEEIALDKTMSSQDPRRLSKTMEAVSGSMTADELLVTRAGQILGTPLYMAPEQFAGEAPTAQSEVFAVGAVGYELLSGEPPFVGEDYSELERNVFTKDPEPIEGLDKEIAALIEKALAKEPDDRFASMAEMRDAVAQIRDRLLAKPSSRWLVPVAAAAVAAAIVGVVVVLNKPDVPPTQPVVLSPQDRYVEQALGEFNLFYNQKAAASLRAALREEPQHPAALAYSIMLPTESGPELDRIVSSAKNVVSKGTVPPRQKTLLKTAIALATAGPKSARDVLAADVRDGTVTRDQELSFWLAELAYRARDYDNAETGFEEALKWSGQEFGGRIYDHYSAVLLYFGKHERALEIGRLYAGAFSGEADAIGVYATTLAAAGKLDDALASAKEARRLYEGEDTVAGLAKIHALRKEFSVARKLYRKSAAMAPNSRRPIRMAALAFLAWMDGDDEEARKAVGDCLPGGDDDEIWQRGPCLWAAGTVWPEKTEIAIGELNKLAAAGTPLRPAYGFPANLAKLLEAQRIYFAGSCWRPDAKSSQTVSLAKDAQVRRRRLLVEGRDFFASYHIPMFSDYARCELDSALVDNASERQ